MGDHVIVASDAALSTVPEGVDFRFTQTAYMHLPSRTGLSNKIGQFLQAGKPPVFIGFGSNPVHSPEKWARLLLDVQQAVQQRFIISRGWAGLNADEGGEDCLFVDDVPFELLFPRVAAVVHHGGTGTVAAAARAGVPQIACPFMADQFLNRDQIVKLGLGPRGCNFKKLTAGLLSAAIAECLNDGYKRKAEEVSRAIGNTDGAEWTRQVVERELAGLT